MYESMVKAQLSAEVIAQRMSVDLQCKYTDPSVVAVANALCEQKPVPIEHVRVLQGYAKTKYSRMSQRVGPEKAAATKQIEKIVRDYKEKLAKGEESGEIFFSELAVKKASEKDIDRTVSVNQSESHRSDLSAQRAAKLKLEAEEEVQKKIAGFIAEKEKDKKK